MALEEVRSRSLRPLLKLRNPRRMPGLPHLRRAGKGRSPPLVGSWELTVDWGGGKTWELAVVVNPDLTGTLKDDQQELTSDLANVKSEGDTVSFSCALGGDKGLELSFEGNVSGDAMEGTVSTGMGDGTFSGVRN